MIIPYEFHSIQVLDDNLYIWHFTLHFWLVWEMQNSGTELKCLFWHLITRMKEEEFRWICVLFILRDLVAHCPQFKTIYKFQNVKNLHRLRPQLFNLVINIAVVTKFLLKKYYHESKQLFFQLSSTLKLTSNLTQKLDSCCYSVIRNQVQRHA